jgi:hypothetical protein
MEDWERDEFDRLAEALNGCAQWNDMAHTYAMFEKAPLLFGTADGVLIYEDGLKVLTWPEARARSAPELEEAQRKREIERRRQRVQDITQTKLPALRKLKAMKALLDELMSLSPTIGPETGRAFGFIRAMSQDDERFAECFRFVDYLRKAIEITAPPEHAPGAEPAVPDEGISEAEHQGEPEPEPAGAPAEDAQDKAGDGAEFEPEREPEPVVHGFGGWVDDLGEVPFRATTAPTSEPEATEPEPEPGAEPALAPEPVESPGVSSGSADAPKTKRGWPPGKKRGPSPRRGQKLGPRKARPVGP